MEIEQAQKQVEDLIEHYGGYWEPLSMFARLVEEVGELGRTMNFAYGGKRKKHDNENESIEEELCDVIFTSMAIANQMGINLSESLSNKINKDYEKCKGVYDIKDKKIKCEGDLEDL